MSFFWLLKDYICCLRPPDTPSFYSQAHQSQLESKHTTQNTSADSEQQFYMLKMQIWGEKKSQWDQSNISEI